MHMPYIQQSQNKIFYFRLHIPKDLRTNIGRKYVRRTLKTRDPNTAFIRAQYLLAHYRKQFDEMRCSMMDGDFYNMIMDSSRQEIKMDMFRIKRPDGVLEMKNVQTETPEEFAWLKSLTQPSAPPVQQTPTQQPAPIKKLSEHLETFLKVIGKKSGVRYVDAVRDAVKNFIEYTGDIAPGEITADIAQEFAESFESWPSNRRKKKEYRKKTLDQILTMDIPEEDRISATTYNNNLTKISSFMLWLHENKLLGIENPFKRLFKKEKAAREQWLDFSVSEVQQVLSRENLVFDPQRPSRYWIPWILAHCGARIEEICALYREDIQYAADIDTWFILIQENQPDKQIKNSYSNRGIPIHSALVKLGFIDYVQSIPGGTRLFPDLIYKENYGYHDKMSDFFSRYLKRIGVYQPKKTLKSFRHTVITALYQTGATREIVPEIVGHTPDSSSMSLSRYHKGFTLEQKREALEKIDWKLSV